MYDITEIYRLTLLRVDKQLKLFQGELDSLVS